MTWITETETDPLQTECDPVVQVAHDQPTVLALLERQTWHQAAATHVSSSVSASSFCVRVFLGIVPCTISIHLCIHIYIFLIHLFIHLIIYLSMYLFIYLFIYLYIYIYIYLYIY